MHSIDTILIEHHISPTLVSKAQKEAFSRYLSLSKSGSIRDFLVFLETYEKELATVTTEVLHIASRLETVVSAMLASLEEALGADPSQAVLFSDFYPSSTLTERHLKILNSLQTQIGELAAVALLIGKLRQLARRSVCSPDLAMETTLRYIALCEGDADTPIRSVYRDLSEASPSFGERVAVLAESIEALIATLEQAASELMVSSSRVLTRVNKKEKPQTEYFKLLRAEQIKLHNQKNAINQMKSEVQYVKIPDVL